MSASSSSTIPPQPHPIPEDIRRDLPDQLTPWKISDAVFDKMSSEQGKYKKAEVLPTDPEWQDPCKVKVHIPANLVSARRGLAK